MSATSSKAPVAPARLGRSRLRTVGAVMVIAVGLSLSTGCSLFKRPAAPAGPAGSAAPPTSPPPEPRPPDPKVETLADRLERADALLAGNQIEAAAGELHSLVEEHPSSAEAPQALFQLAVVYLSPDSPLYDGSQGIGLLRNLVEAYPGTSWSLASETILRLARTNASLRDVAAQLQEQLDELKRIDIGSDG